MLTVELAATMVGLCFAFLSFFASDGCSSDRCYRLVGYVWVWLVVVHMVLGVVCGVAFWRSNWVAVRRAVALLLPICLVATWVVADRMLTKALNM